MSDFVYKLHTISRYNTAEELSSDFCALLDGTYKAPEGWEVVSVTMVTGATGFHGFHERITFLLRSPAPSASPYRG